MNQSDLFFTWRADHWVHLRVFPFCSTYTDALSYIDRLHNMGSGNKQYYAVFSVQGNVFLSRKTLYSTYYINKVSYLIMITNNRCAVNSCLKILDSPEQTSICLTHQLWIQINYIRSFKYHRSQMEQEWSKIWAPRAFIEKDNKKLSQALRMLVTLASLIWHTLNTL